MLVLFYNGIHSVIFLVVLVFSTFQRLELNLNLKPYFRESLKSVRNAKAAFRKKTLFTNKLDLNLRKDLLKCYIWGIALNSAEI